MQALEQIVKGDRSPKLSLVSTKNAACSMSCLCRLVLFSSCQYTLVAPDHDRGTALAQTCRIRGCQRSPLAEHNNHIAERDTHQSGEKIVPKPVVG